MDVTGVLAKRMEKLDGPTNPIVSPLLTDLYQFTMAYAYWKAGKHLERAAFDLFFRKNPFGGEFTIFAGLEECIRFIVNFKLEEEEIAFLRSVLPSTCDAGFFDYLEGVDCSDVEVHAIPEGSVVFPKVPLLRVEGPVAVVQLLLETPFLNLINYGSLVATNAARHRMIAGKSKVLLEFGLRRAQGPDGGISASKYCYIGEFDATSNIAAGKKFGIPLRGTHSHAFVSSFMLVDLVDDQPVSPGSSSLLGHSSCPVDCLGTLDPKKVKGKIIACLSDSIDMNILKDVEVKEAGGVGMIVCNDEDAGNVLNPEAYFLPATQLSLNDSKEVFAYINSTSPVEIIDKVLPRRDNPDSSEDFVSLVQSWLNKLQAADSLRGTFSETNLSELAAFTTYALAFPSSFLALVDTYDVMMSGVPNFCAVALALNDLGYKANGIRLDSGDLAYLSIQARKFFCAVEREFGICGFGDMTITASNDINEQTLDALNKQAHEVDAFGIGTHLVTCYAQPALGCVFKLVEINDQPRTKLSEDISKVSIPCKKQCYRLYGREGYPMTAEKEPPPKVGERILCRHPFNESKRAYVVPQQVEQLLKCYWPGKSGKQREELPTLSEIRTRCIDQLAQMRPDHLRRLNPTPYKVSVSAELYDFIHFLWLNEAPVGELQ